MANMKIEVINNLESVLPCYIIGTQGLITTLDKTKPETNVYELKPDVDTQKNNTQTYKWEEYKPNSDRGDLAEEYIERKLNSQINSLPHVKSIERVSKSRRNYHPGYDIEVILKDNSVIGMEIKGTTLKDANIIHITNNELSSAIRNKDNYYIIIVVFKDNTKCVDKVYSIKNPIKSFEINESELLKILKTKKIGYADIYEQQFILNLDVNVLSRHLLRDNELLL